MSAEKRTKFQAKSKYIWYSPYKLRPLIDVIRNKDVVYALNWLSTYKTKKTVPIKKTLESAIANAKNLAGVELNSLAIKDVRIDQGPIYKYFKPAAMGRAMPQRKRLCHISIILESNESK